MNVLLKSATIVDKKSPFHFQKMDVLIEKGHISNIARNITAPDNTKTVDLPNLHISQGWFDSSVSFGAPGYEERENLENGLQTAALSGFSGVAIQPNTLPKIDTAAAVTFLKSVGATTATEIFPIGALTQGNDAKDLAELYDMQAHKAVSFGDYKQPITNPNLLKLALQYAQGFGGIVQSYPQDNAIAGNGMVNEHIVSTQLGLKGIPNLAEALQIARDLYILEYSGGKLHIPTISTAQSVELIKEAKSKGLQVTCSVAVHHLLLSDENLVQFNTNYKVQPPLRTTDDMEALTQAVLDGTIDMITSDHCPMDIENKQVEFDNAAYGTIGLESAFGALGVTLPLEVIVDKLTAARNCFGVETQVIDTHSPANLSLFNPEANYTFTTESILSTSKNSAFIGMQLKGKVYGIYAKQKLVIHTQNNE